MNFEQQVMQGIMGQVATLQAQRGYAMPPPIQQPQPIASLPMPSVQSYQPTVRAAMRHPVVALPAVAAAPSFEDQVGRSVTTEVGAIIAQRDFYAPGSKTSNYYVAPMPSPSRLLSLNRAARIPVRPWAEHGHGSDSGCAVGRDPLLAFEKLRLSGSQQGRAPISVPYTGPVCGPRARHLVTAGGYVGPGYAGTIGLPGSRGSDPGGQIGIALGCIAACMALNAWNAEIGLIPCSIACGVVLMT